MSNKFISYLTIGLIVLLMSANFASAEKITMDNKSMLLEANAFFETEKFNQSAELYGALYDNGFYTEKMLYRLAFMNEKLRNYPEAIFFLKKIQQEYGGELIQGKIVQLMQKNGSSSYLTEDLTNDWLFFMRRFGWIFWTLLLISLSILLFFFFTWKKETVKWKSVSVGISIPVFIICFCVLGYHLFMVPDRGIITQKTAYYDFPGYGANYSFNALSTGETVEIKGQKDIWFQVQAGQKQFWVPKRVVRKL